MVHCQGFSLAGTDNILSISDKVWVLVSSTGLGLWMCWPDLFDGSDQTQIFFQAWGAFVINKVPYSWPVYFSAKSTLYLGGTTT